MQRAIALAFASFLLLAAPAARADDAWDDERRNSQSEGDGDTSVWEKRRLALDAHVGIGTPYGLAGVAFEVAPLSWWTIGVGAGTSFFGPQAAVSTRVRYAFGHTAVAIGIGGSGGPFESTHGWYDPSWRKHWNVASWFNVEGSFEHRWADGFQVRFYFGVETLLNPGDATCTVDTNNAHDCNSGGTLGKGLLVTVGDGNVPYMGLAIGHAFEL